MKKTLLIVLCFCFVLSFASCSEGENSDYVSFEPFFNDENDDWKTSLLYKAGLSNIVEPEGEKVFKEEENGNFSFTITPADTTTLSALSSGVFSQASHFSEEMNPRTLLEAKDSETHFKLTYCINKKDVTVEITLEGNVVTANVSFS